jgi:6-phosphogluconolactonase
MTVFQINSKLEEDRLKMPLEREQVIASPVKFPRSFALDPTGKWLVLAGETDNRLAVMKIDAASGQLTPTDQTAEVGRPVCVLFAPPNQR